MNVSLKPLNEQTIVITGASSGIGLATARMAAERGARVLLVARDEDALSAATNDLREAGHEAAYAVADVGDPEQVRRVADVARERFGGFDTWINDAAVSIYGRLMDVPLEDARRLFDTNYWGVVHGSQVAAEHLRERGGAIINLGSTVSDRSIPLQGHYAASKHAIKAFTESLRMELEKDEQPIAVTLIQPGSIDTPFPEHAKNYTDAAPTVPPPVYEPDVVARAILDCCVTPRRTVSVGAGSKMIQAMNSTPGLADRYMEATQFAGQQQDPAQAGGEHRTDSLYSPSGREPRKRGDYPGHTAASSAFTRARLHPVKALGLATAAGAAVTALVKAARS